jgi:hypothetical protein
MFRPSLIIALLSCGTALSAANVVVDSSFDSAWVDDASLTPSDAGSGWQARAGKRWALDVGGYASVVNGSGPECMGQVISTTATGEHHLSFRINNPDHVAVYVEVFQVDSSIDFTSNCFLGYGHPNHKLQDPISKDEVGAQVAEYAYPIEGPFPTTDANGWADIDLATTISLSGTDMLVVMLTLPEGYSDTPSQLLIDDVMIESAGLGDIALTAQAVSHEEVQLNWTAPTGFSGEYELIRSTDDQIAEGGTLDANDAIIYSGPNTSYNDNDAGNGLSPSTTYFYRVNAIE